MTTDDPAESLADLRDRLDVWAQRHEDAARATAPETGTAGDGSVRVELDRDGAFARVALTSTWRNALSGDELPGAVLAAYADAGARRARHWAEASAGAVGDDRRPRPDLPALDPVTIELEEAVRGGRDAAPPSAEVMRGLRDVLREINAGLDAAADAIADRAGREHEGRSSSGKARAWVAGHGVLVRIELDPSLTSRSHATNIAREITEAVRAAALVAATSRPDDLWDGTDLAGTMHDASDPRRLARRLGLF